MGVLQLSAVIGQGNWVSFHSFWEGFESVLADLFIYLFGTWRSSLVRP